MSSTALICPFPGSPPLNTDIAGIGVRISTYVQSLLTSKCLIPQRIPSPSISRLTRSHRLVVFLTVSPDIDKVYDQSFPFVIMNISVMVAALVLGFSANPQISLQECVRFRS